MSVGGIDVSDYQRAVDWSAVAGAGIAFAFTKATEGVSFVAETFASNWLATQGAGIIRGAYHFFRPLRDPQAQADHFLATVQPGAGDLPAALDAEVRDGVDARAFVDRMKEWLDAVEEATGRKPIIYTSPSFWEALGSPRLSGYPLWIANYGRSSPIIPRGWSTYTFWQYTSSGSVTGIAGMVDLNVFNGSLDDLMAFLRTDQTPSDGRVSDEFVYEGDVGLEVEEVQKLLRAKGFDPGSIDGVFGPRTKAAVVAFQMANNVIVDGIVGPQTLARLRA